MLESLRRIPSVRSGMVAIYFTFSFLSFFCLQRTLVRLAPSEPEVKGNTRNFVTFICQRIKNEKFEFFGASRATRQRHFKTSSTGPKIRHDERNSKKLRTNQKECPDQETFLDFLKGLDHAILGNSPLIKLS